jgi:preprotein translocase subunit SecG
MEIIKTLLWVVQMLSAVSIVTLVLLQQGKGADAGATFGSSGSSSLFGSSGSSNFLSRCTAIGALLFFATTIALVISANKGRVGDLGVMANMEKSAPSKAVAVNPAVAKKGVAVESQAGKNQIPD